jgi:hypothetical protein
MAKDATFPLRPYCTLPRSVFSFAIMLAHQWYLCLRSDFGLRLPTRVLNTLCVKKRKSCMFEMGDVPVYWVFAAIMLCGFVYEP